MPLLPLIKRLFYRIDSLLLIMIMGIFISMPELDLAVSQLFYRSESGFVLANHPVAKFIYDYTNYLGYGILITLPLAIIFFIIRRATQHQTHKKAAIYLFICALLGPIVIVDAVLKKGLDRPRPVQVEQFGGNYTFEPAFAPTFTCDECESFVSGHAAVGFYFFALLLLTKKRRWLWGTLALASIISFTRIAQGGHFLSDVVFSGFTVWFCCYLVYWIMFEKYLTRSPSAQPQRS